MQFFRTITLQSKNVLPERYYKELLSKKPIEVVYSKFFLVDRLLDISFLLLHYVGQLSKINHDHSLPIQIKLFTSV